MNLLIIITGILLIVASLFLIIAVLMQSAKNSRMSGVVSGGGAETFFGKYKGKTIDKKLNRLTIVIALIFAAIVIALYVFQLGTGKIKYGDSNDYLNAAATATTTTAAETEAPTTTTTSGNATESTPATTEEAPTTTESAPATTEEAPTTTGDAPATTEPEAEG